MRHATSFASAIGVSIILMISGCSSEKPAEPVKTSRADSAIKEMMTPGKAGGEIESTFTASATVTGIDKAKRTVTLQTPEGNKATFEASPEVRNFDQIRLGDKVNATFEEKLMVFVREGSTMPRASHTESISTAPKGAKPGAIVAESYELAATILAIDTANRLATLKFADGQPRFVQVRPDVDLSKYKAGDSVVIRVSESLKILVRQP